MYSSSYCRYIRCAKRAPPRNRRCLGAGEACSYSKRRPRLGGAQFPAAAAGPMASGGWASDQSIYGPATLPAGCDRNTVASVALPARPGESAALQQYGSMSLKRFGNKLYVRALVVALFGVRITAVVEACLKQVPARLFVPEICACKPGSSVDSCTRTSMTSTTLAAYGHARSTLEVSTRTYKQKHCS